jgi:WD40 repeat protein/actin-like ATPase involved in cell morphogenesis
MVGRIAIDFGTERTKVSYLSAPGRSPELLRFVYEENEKSFVPSLFYLPKESDQLLFGYEAEAMLEEDPVGVIDDLKRRLHEGRRRANGREATPRAMLAKLFAYLRDQSRENVAAFNGDAPDEVVLTVPPAFGPAQRDVVRNAALDAGFKTVVEMIDEPVAAARAWLADCGDEVDHIVVLDCGGGTVDWAYLRRDSVGAIRVAANCPPGGIDRLGGRDIDDGLVELVECKLAEAGEDSVEFGVTRRPRLRARLRRIKESMTRNSQQNFTVRVGDRAVTIDRTEIDAVVYDKFVARATDGLRAYFDRVAKVYPGRDAPHALMVGGSGRLAGLKEAIAKLGFEVTAWDRADFAAAIGALCTEKEPSAGWAQVKKDRAIAKKREEQEKAGPVRQLKLRLEKLPKLSANDDSAEIAEKEAILALSKGNGELALLLALIAWQRVYASGKHPSQNLYDLIKSASIVGGRIKRVTRKGAFLGTCFYELNNLIYYSSPDLDTLETIDFDLEDGPVERNIGKMQYSGSYKGIPTWQLDRWFGVGLVSIRENSSAISSQRYNLLIEPGGSNWEIKDHPRCLHLDPRGNRVVGGFETGIVKQFDAATGNLVVIEIAAGTIGNVSPITNVQYSSNSRRILSADENGNVQEWDASNGARIGHWLTHNCKVIYATYSPDDRLIVTITVKGEAYFWDRSTGLRLADVATHRHEDSLDGEPLDDDEENTVSEQKAQILDIVFSPTQQLALTYATNGTAKLWNLESGRFEGVELVHDENGDRLVAAAFSSDGRLVATLGKDRLVKLWAVSSRFDGIISDCPIGESFLVDDRASFVKFTENDRCLLIVGADFASCWDVSTALLDGDELVEHLCYHRLKPNRILTADEHRATLIDDASLDPIAACMSILPQPSTKASPT